MLLEIKNYTTIGQLLKFECENTVFELEIPVGLLKIGITSLREEIAVSVTLTSQDYRNTELVLKSEYPLKKNVLEIKDKRGYSKSNINGHLTESTRPQIPLLVLQSSDGTETDADILWKT